jgi:hypothetical protein
LEVIPNFNGLFENCDNWPGIFPVVPCVFPAVPAVHFEQINRHSLYNTIDECVPNDCTLQQRVVSVRIGILGIAFSKMVTETIS